MKLATSCTLVALTLAIGAADALAANAGGDFNIYEVDFGVQEFSDISVAVSEDGTNFFTFANSAPSRVPIVDVDNDPGHTGDIYGRAYDIALSGFTSVRFVRVDGNGGSAARRGLASTSTLSAR